MNTELTALLVTAASVGLVHTLLGPDHYLPFVMIARARKWSGFKTATITTLCGLGHVLSSIVLGVIGIALGSAVTKLEAIETVRGDYAAWALIAFGLVYFVWGMRKALKNTQHGHSHKLDGDISPWVLFIVFVLGPCEVLIPMLMYPAARDSNSGMILVALVFGVATLLTMVISVLVLRAGISMVPIGKLERYAHALAGGVIALCGIAIQFGL